MNTTRLVERLILLALGVFTAHAALAAPEQAAEPEKPRTVIGRVENVVLQDVHVKLKARIDTGAGGSSIDAQAIEATQNAQSGTNPPRRKVVGWSNIKVMGTDRMNRRPIVKLDVCLGGKKLEGRVNLTDRGAFLYPVLIGRNLLITGKFLVDPGATDRQEPG